MRSWPLRIEPRDCRGWRRGLAAAHVLGAAVPWLAPTAPLTAALLSALALAALPWSLAVVPGPRAAVQALAAGDGPLRLRLRDGREVEAELLPSSWALRDAAWLRLAWAGGRAGWWLPRGALPAADFRRLKAAVRQAR